jgi:hypothetical protein
MDGPWLQYPPGDPLNNPSNWFQAQDGTWMPVSAIPASGSASPTDPAREFSYPPPQQITVMPLPSITPSYQPSASEQVMASQRNQQGGAPPPAPTSYPPIGIGGGGMSGAPPTSTIGTGTGADDTMFQKTNYKKKNKD